MCMSLKEISLYYGPDYNPIIYHAGDGKHADYTSWESSIISMCNCDFGFFGPDCSLSKINYNSFFISYYISKLFIIPKKCVLKETIR